MSGNAKQRVTLTNLNEPQQMRELNRQMTWIWDQLLGGISMKSLNAGAREVINSKASSEEVDELGNVVASHSTQLIQTDEKIALKADQTTVDALSGTVEKHSSQLEVTAEQIGSKADKSVVDALGNTVSEHSTAITQTAEKIESTATAVETLEGRVKKNESEIEQTAEKISAAVKSVQIGGTNLAALSRLAFGNSDGGSTGGLTDRAAGTTHYCRSGKIVRLHPFSGYYNLARFRGVAMEAGRQYTVSFWAACTTDGTPVTVNTWNNGRGVDMALGSAVSAGPSGGYYTRTFTCPTSDTYELRFICFNGHDGEIHIMDVKLEEGNKATAWSPAPEDTDEAIAELSAELAVQAGKISANATAIETVRTQADSTDASLTAVTKRVTTAEANISALDGKISSKVSQTDFNALGDRVSSAEGELVVQSSEISAEVVRATAAEEALSGRISVQEDRVELAVNRTVGGTNLAAIGRTSFGNSAGTLTGAVEDRSEAHYCRSRKVMRLYAFSGSYNAGQYDKIQLASGKEYTVSFWAAAGADGQRLWVNIWNYGRSVDLNLGEVISTRAGGGYYTRTFTCTETDTYALRFINFGGHTSQIMLMDVKIEEGNTATAWSAHPEELRAGSNMEITENRVKIASPETLIAIPDEGGEAMVAQFDENGLTAERVNAGNVAVRYDGASTLYVNPNATGEQLAAGNYYRSLTDACAAVSGKNLDQEITINVQGDSYGSAQLVGIYGRGGVRLSGNNHSLTGSLTIRRNTAEIFVSGLTVVGTGSAAVDQSGPGWMRWSGCTFIGSGADGSYGLRMYQKAAAFLYDCGLYGAEHLLGVATSADVLCNTLRGGGGTNFLYGDGGSVKWYGTRPDGNLRIDHPTLREPYDLAALTIDYGTAQPSAPVISTAVYDFLYSDSYAGGWSAFADEDVRQGYSGERIYGVIWFDAAAMRAELTGKTIKQASLRLYMHKGVGRGVDVSVRLYGTNVSYDRTDKPELTANYGTIGSTVPGEANEITIPAQAITDLVNGTTQALALFSDDAEYYKNRGYSKNYAKFAGSTSGDAETGPRLTVAYQ